MASSSSWHIGIWSITARWWGPPASPTSRQIRFSSICQLYRLTVAEIVNCGVVNHDEVDRGYCLFLVLRGHRGHRQTLDHVRDPDGRDALNALGARIARSHGMHLSYRFVPFLACDDSRPLPWKPAININLGHCCLQSI